MYVRYCFLCLSLLMGAMFAAAQDVTHVIQRGETIYSIARSYGVKQEDILTLNGIRDPGRILAGQRLRIPVEGRDAEVSGGFIEYRVTKGEAFYGIARRHGTTVEAIRRANNFSDAYVLKEGDLLRIPGPPGASGTAAAAVPGNGGAPPAETAGTAAGAAIAAPPAASAAAAGAGNAGKAPPPAAPRPVVTGKVDPSVRWPVNAKEVMYMTGKLYGVVLLGEQSESVKSLTQGTVVSAGPYRGFGRVAIVQVTGGYLYVYGGCESLSVKEGDRVAPGTELGKLGIDAVAVKPQLFFLVYRSNTPIDPAKAPRA
ncbi:MAG: LysM peptidoglycan-binding domain-containing protein [Treponema sp.]|jgi:murein DD-endopeptidase MepM/ murein hydrolase activator NlpD|nr:LysM peptidoglycan-binding domain-containing protein [Treponema sp.]